MNTAAVEAEILREIMGPTLILGEPPASVLQALSAAADPVYSDQPSVVEYLTEEGGVGVGPIAAAPSIVTSTLIWGNVGPDELDPCVARLADGGALIAEMPNRGLAAKRTLRMFEATGITVVDIESAAPTRSVVLGHRKAPGRDAPAATVPDPCDVAVVMLADGRLDAAHATVIDVLFRQSLPPGLLLVVDTSRDDDQKIPADLWGMAPHALTQPALLPMPGTDLSEALREALEAVEETAICVVTPDVRLAPNHTALLADALEQLDEPGVAEGEVIDLAGAARRLACGQSSSSAATLAIASSLRGTADPIEALAAARRDGVVAQLETPIAVVGVGPTAI